MKKLLWQSGLLFLSFGFVYIWQATDFNQYTIQTMAVFIILFLLVSIRKRKNTANKITTSESLSVIILNVVILLLVMATRNFSSSFFFLLYFLAFGIAFLLEPATIVVFILGLFFVFSPYVFIDDVTGNIIRLISVALIGPLAYFFGKEFKHGEEQAEEIDKIRKEAISASKQIENDVSEVLNNEKDSIPLEDAQKLEDALQKSHALKEENKD